MPSTTENKAAAPRPATQIRIRASAVREGQRVFVSAAVVAARAALRRRRSGAAAGLAIALGLVGCAPAAPSATRPRTTVGIVLQDFKITAGASGLAAGPVTFDVVNAGPSTHELNVDRTQDSADGLPIGPTGLLVAESDPALQRVGSVEAVGIAEHRRVTINLTPGHYVFYCNLRGHYLSNMRVSVDVY